MDDRRWERWSALGGIAFVLLIAATAVLQGSPPKPSDPAATITRFLFDKETELRWSAYLTGLAFVAVFWWAGAVWRLLRRAEGGTPRLAVLAVGGLLFGNAMAALSSLLLSASVMSSGWAGQGPSSLKAMYTTSAVIGGATAFGVAAFLGAFSAVIIRTGVLPRGLGWFGALVALVALVAGGAVASSRDVFFVLGDVTFAGLGIWVLIASVLMVRAHDAQTAATSAA
jgi:hypothetical protein